MAILLVLLPADAPTCLQPSSLAALASLGVTDIAVVRDERSVGVVVEGWAFDPIHSSEAVLAAVSGAHGAARSLGPVMEMRISQGGTT